MKSCARACEWVQIKFQKEMLDKVEKTPLTTYNEKAPMEERVQVLVSLAT